MGQHHGSDRGGDEQRRGGLEGEDIAIEERCSNALGVASVGRVGIIQPDGGTDDRVADGEDQQRAETQPREEASGRWPLIVSTRDSAMSTPTSISTNKNSIKIAPV